MIKRGLAWAVVVGAYALLAEAVGANVRGDYYHEEPGRDFSMGCLVGASLAAVKWAFRELGEGEGAGK